MVWRCSIYETDEIVCSTSNSRTSLINLVISIWWQRGKVQKKLQWVRGGFLHEKVMKNFSRSSLRIWLLTPGEWIVHSFFSWMTTRYSELSRSVIISTIRDSLLMAMDEDILATDSVRVREGSDSRRRCFVWFSNKLESSDSRKYSYLRTKIILPHGRL